MKFLENLYNQDQKNITRWRTGELTDEEFYKLNRSLRNKVDVLINKKKDLTGREYYIVAMIYHHGFKIHASKKAIKYAREAVEKGYTKYKWLIASATDRLLQLQGKPQKYGTQIVELKSGKIKLYKLDGTITDEQRKEIGLPSLKKLKKSLE